MKGRLVSPTEFNDWATEIGNFGFGYTDFATGKASCFKEARKSVSLHYVILLTFSLNRRNYIHQTLYGYFWFLDKKSSQSAKQFFILECF